jgi:hypothetical protein
MKRMPLGIAIVINPEKENLDPSIRYKFDLNSNEIDERELHRKNMIRTNRKPNMKSKIFVETGRPSSHSSTLQ